MCLLRMYSLLSVSLKTKMTEKSRGDKRLLRRTKLNSWPFESRKSQLRWLKASCAFGINRSLFSQFGKSGFGSASSCCISMSLRILDISIFIPKIVGLALCFSELIGFVPIGALTFGTHTRDVSRSTGIPLMTTAAFVRLWFHGSDLNLCRRHIPFLQRDTQSIYSQY